jgi:hypothetical protein
MREKSQWKSIGFRECSTLQESLRIIDKHISFLVRSKIIESISIEDTWWGILMALDQYLFIFPCDRAIVLKLWEWLLHESFIYVKILHLACSTIYIYWWNLVHSTNNRVFWKEVISSKLLSRFKTSLYLLWGFILHKPYTLRCVNFDQVSIVFLVEWVYMW